MTYLSRCRDISEALRCVVLTQRLSEPVREGPESLLSESAVLAHIESESAVLAHIDMYSEGLSAPKSLLRGRGS